MCIVSVSLRDLDEGSNTLYHTIASVDRINHYNPSTCWQVIDNSSIGISCSRNDVISITGIDEFHILVHKWPTTLVSEEQVDLPLRVKPDASSHDFSAKSDFEVTVPCHDTRTEQVSRSRVRDFDIDAVGASLDRNHCMAG